MPDIFEPWQYFMWQEVAVGCYHLNQISVWALGQLVGSTLFLGGCSVSREVPWPHRPDSAEQRGDALEDSLLQVLFIFKAFCRKLWKDQVMQ